jgi:translocation and assembly module TamB
MIKRIIAFIIALLIVLSFFIGIMLTTTTGLNFALRIASDISGSTISAKTVHGQLLGHIELDHFIYQDQSIKVNIKKLKLQWQPRALFTWTVDIASLHVDNVQITQLSHTPTKKETENNSDFALPIKLALNDILINNVSYQALAKPAITVSSLALQARATQQSIQIKRGEIALFGGKLSITGTANWQKKLRWQATLNAQKIQLSHYFPHLKGHLNVDITTTGRETKNPTATFILKDLSGQLQQQNVSGRGEFLLKNHTLSTTGFKLNIAGNTLNLVGELSKQSHLSWSIKANALKQLSSQFNGSILSKGTVTKNYLQPTLTTDTTIKNLNTPVAQIHFLHLAGHVDTQFKTPSSLMLKANKIDYGKYHFTSAVISAQGTKEKHTLNANINAPHGQLILKSHGQKEKNKLLETLEELSLTSKTLSNWRLNKPVIFTFQSNKQLIGEASVSPFCWKSKNGHLCFQGNWSHSAPWQAKLALKKFNLGVLKILLPAALSVQSDLNGHVQLQGAPNKAITGNVNLSLASAQLHYASTQASKTLDLANSSINARLDRSSLNAKLHINTKNRQFPLDMTIDLPKFNLLDPPAKQSLQGSIHINWQHLNLLQNIIPDASKISGTFLTKLALAGTLQKPRLTGEINLQHANVNLDTYGLSLRHINLVIKALRSGKITLNAQLKSGAGSLTATGSSNTTNWFETADLALSGKNLTVMKTKAFDIALSPALKIHHQKQKTTITGTVHIDHAKIHPQDFTSTVTLPDNFVVIRREENKAVEKALALFANIKIDLGKKINVKYSGLRSQLTGTLNLKLRPMRPTTATGTINIQGKYDAYNQKLKINQGRLIYTGGSVENPVINVVASKSIPVYDLGGTTGTPTAEITVGVKITGTASAPIITLYSSPSMSNNDILSYLIFGKSSKSLSSSKYALLGPAASMLTGGSGDGLVNGFKDKLGLSEMGLESSEVYVPGQSSSQSNTSFVVGKNITKRLKVLYSIGITIPINILILQFSVFKHWQLQTASSSYETAGDILYTIQTN